ncbi:Hypothetical_protein [Hexamita inflata]|uniref:Hypothetical_protein n=1 Tax=Hexamita inflata TaxID=28002 RepID=A0AA86UX51_9EUKA|nr:Hypothetical protein HINF_LOCUS39393 [Hexamita inflata]
MNEILQIQNISQSISDSQQNLQIVQQDLKKTQLQILQAEQQLQQFKFTSISQNDNSQFNLQLIENADNAEETADKLSTLCLDLLNIKRNYKANLSLITKYKQIEQQLITNQIFQSESELILSKYLIPIKNELIKVKKEIIGFLIEYKNKNLLVELLGQVQADILID